MATEHVLPSKSAQLDEAHFTPRFRWLSDTALMNVLLWPTLILMIFITIFPMIWSLYLAFTRYSVVRDSNWLTAPGVGFGNFNTLLADPNFWQRFQISASFVIPAVIVEFVLGFGIAVLLNNLPKGKEIVSTIIMIPMMLTPVVVALFWRLLFQADIGVINFIIHNVLGLPPVNWLADRHAAIWALVVVDAWQWTPFMMLISLAGLSAVPRYLYEAAEVDRASGWFKFWNITVPMVTPLLMIGLLFRLMDAYKIFELSFVLTQGGPGDFSKGLPFYLYEVAFRQFNTSSASAIGYIMLIVIIALCNLLIRALNRIKSEPQR
ncbi:MAG: sugar ABC transporter permease [Anaerolineaceae bacterium]|nr:sugar ABC transporter permease [Anaerolineaceae bacterium]